MKKFMLCAALCGLLFTGGAAQAAGFNGPGPRGGDNQGWNQSLTPQQRQQAEKIFTENFSSMDETRQLLAQKRQQLDSELASDNPDPALIEALSREIGDLRGKMLAARVKVRSQLSEQGLPRDFYGPGGPRPRKGKQRGPEVWHGGRHGHGHDRGYGYGMMGPWRGCMGGCWGY